MFQFVPLVNKSNSLQSAGCSLHLIICRSLHSQKIVNLYILIPEEVVRQAKLKKQITNGILRIIKKQVFERGRAMRSSTTQIKAKSQLASFECNVRLMWPSMLNLSAMSAGGVQLSFLCFPLSLKLIVFSHVVFLLELQILLIIFMFNYNTSENQKSYLFSYSSTTKNYTKDKTD